MGDAPPTLLQISNVEKELIDLIEKKKQIERNLINLEVQIFNYESAYLEESKKYGNLIGGGLDVYAASSVRSTGGGGETGGSVPLAVSSSSRRRGAGSGGGGPRSRDRIFSNSSATFQKALNIHNRLLAGEEQYLTKSSGNGEGATASRRRIATTSEGDLSSFESSA